MRLGLSFGLGPLRAWFPLNGGRRRRPRSGSPGVGCLPWVVLALVVAVGWPYLAARALGPSVGWTERRAAGIGAVATVVWVVVALVVNATTN